MSRPKKAVADNLSGLTSNTKVLLEATEVKVDHTQSYLKHQHAGVLKPHHPTVMEDILFLNLYLIVRVYRARNSIFITYNCPMFSLEELERHKREPLHLEATKKERKMSKCSLCKKQFTSPPQLKVSK